MKLRAILTSVAVCATIGTAAAEETFSAKLAGHAYLPAMTMIAPPADAPRDAWISGKFTGKTRNMEPMTVMGDVGAAYGSHPTGISLPFLGQPMQGMSGFASNRAEDGSVYALTDNGFGSKVNSPDAMLFFHRLKPDFASGKVERLETIFLRDPDNKVPFRIAYEGTEGRYLTGADFDPESIQFLNNEIWLGEEFGPYIIHATSDGRVLDVYPTMLEGEALRGPDTPGVTVPSAAGKDFRVQRSGGYEGMALQPKGNLLWGMLEKPLLGPDGQPQGQYLTVLTFDTGKGDWSSDVCSSDLNPCSTAKHFAVPIRRASPFRPLRARISACSVPAAMKAWPCSRKATFCGACWKSRCLAPTASRKASISPC